jgi:hypothetical protein
MKAGGKQNLPLLYAVTNMKHIAISVAGSDSASGLSLTIPKAATFIFMP